MLASAVGLASSHISHWLLTDNQPAVPYAYIPVSHSRIMFVTWMFLSNVSTQ